MKSPITGKEMKLVKELTNLPYRRDNFQVVYHYFLCEDTGERFTNDELDTINIAQVHNQYREKNGIPQPDQIKRIREKYEVSASKMSDILGLGANTYRLYENGDMPTVANGRLILSVEQPEEFIRQVNASTHLLSEKEVSKFIEKAKSVEKEESGNLNFESLLRISLNRHESNEFTGYRKFDLDRTSQVIAFFSNKIDLYKTKLNKLFFYADFYHYQITGQSITGMRYRAIPHGPVPSDYDKVFVVLNDVNKINIDQVPFDNGNFGEVIKTMDNFEPKLFSETELIILGSVANRFKGLTTKQVEDISHCEPAWIENQEKRSLISYQKYAYDLKALEFSNQKSSKITLS